MLDRRRIGLLPKAAGVINIGRGGLVDQDALCDALEAGALSGAVLDVFVPEPVPPGHRLWTTPNLIMTPHVSSDDRHAYNARSLDTFIRNLQAFERGEALPNLFDRKRCSSLTQPSPKGRGLLEVHARRATPAWA